MTTHKYGRRKMLWLLMLFYIRKFENDDLFFGGGGKGVCYWKVLQYSLEKIIRRVCQINLNANLKMHNLFVKYTTWLQLNLLLFISWFDFSLLLLLLFLVNKDNSKSSVRILIKQQLSVNVKYISRKRLYFQVNIWKFVYLNWGEWYKDMIDHH